MIKKLNRFINYSIISAILFIILGVIIIIFPNTSLKIFSNILAIMGIFLGIYLIILDINISKKYTPLNTITSGILLLLFGIILLIYPNTLNILIPIIVGIWFILSSVNKLKIAFVFKNLSLPSFIITITVSILSMICGIIFIFNPITSSAVLTIISGYIIIIYAISNLIDAIFLKRNTRKFKKEIKENIKIIIDE